VEIQFDGTLKNVSLEQLRKIPQAVNWFKTSSHYRLKTHFQFDKKGGLTINIQTHPDDLILVGIEIDEIKNVFFR
jgi:hypothetical protein